MTTPMQNQSTQPLEGYLQSVADLVTPKSPIGTQENYIDLEQGTPYVVLPKDHTLHDLEHLLPSPQRRRARVTTTATPSFIEYLNRHSLSQHTVIYADIDTEKNRFNLLAVLDDHTTAHQPDWREHTCAFSPRQAVEWHRWLGNNKANMTQAQFAAWLEDNLADIASLEGMPTGTQMLEMALAFEATADKRLKSRINLQHGGVRFEYVDDEDKDTRTSMQVFERFTLGLPVFEDSQAAYPLEARLKYREKDGKVNFWYELIRPDKIFKTAVLEELEAISTATELPIIHGTPGL